MDRTVGWRASRIARRYTNTSTNSMGRVQTPTLGFIVERELEREAHVPVRYFEVTAATSVTDWRVRFHEKLDEKHRFSAYRTAKASLAESAHAALVAAGHVQVSTVTRRDRCRRLPELRAQRAVDVRDPGRREARVVRYWKFIVASLVGLAVNAVVLVALIGTFSFPLLVIPQAFGIAAGMVVNFVASRHMVFQRSR
jgi:hypothetical protein